jgi:hypothetical protein
MRPFLAGLATILIPAIPPQNSDPAAQLASLGNQAEQNKNRARSAKVPSGRFQAWLRSQRRWDRRRKRATAQLSSLTCRRLCPTSGLRTWCQIRDRMSQGCRIGLHTTGSSHTYGGCRDIVAGYCDNMSSVWPVIKAVRTLLTEDSTCRISDCRQDGSLRRSIAYSASRPSGSSDV